MIKMTDVEFDTKMNTIGGGVLQGINKALDLAEQEEQYKGVVISNEGENFSAGAWMVHCLWLCI